MAKPTRTLTEAQRAYEARRAAKAGMSLDKWLSLKDRQATEAATAEARARKPAKPPGFFARLIEERA